MAYTQMRSLRPGKNQHQNRQITGTDHPIIPFVEGDGTGRHLRASSRVLDAAVAKAYNGKREITGWKYLLAKKHSGDFITGRMKPRKPLEISWLASRT
jgi:isocitrate dehydrogenase